MKAIMKKKKQDYWQCFCTKHGEENLWEVVRWAKDPLRVKEKMKWLKGKDGKELGSDTERVDGLIRDIFGQVE